MPTVPFTIQDLQHRASKDGVNYRLDDDPPGGLQAVQDDADADVALYLYERYDTNSQQYYANKWVKQALIVRGLVVLCDRRFNDVPDSLAKRWATLEKQLILIQAGKLKVPNLALRKADVPVMSNVKVRLWPVMQPLVQRAHSTGNPEGYTRNDDALEAPPVP